LKVTSALIGNILTRTTGYLETVSSHSAQPYRGCSLGRSLCGVGCYVRHNHYLTRGEEWGTFLEARENAGESYLENYRVESRWARKHRGNFSIFLSSSTEPFLPQESICGVTRALLSAMGEAPPDVLIVQTHSHLVLDHLGQLQALGERCALRVQVSIETDRDELPGLPASFSSIDARFEAARRFREAGIETVVTVSPLLPIRDEEVFFERIAECADAVVLDHFIGGDGSPSGSRTRRTSLPGKMESLHPGSTELSYRDRMVELARRRLPGRVGVGIDGFAGRYLPD
jgi:DNA repair photolyase